jgi:hypothetical protein
VKKQNIYLALSIFLFILLCAALYERYTISEELNDFKANLSKLEMESKQKLIDAEKFAENKIEEATILADSKIKDAEKLKVKYEKLLDREEKKLHNYFGNLYRYNNSDNLLNDTAINKFRIDGNKIFVTIQNNGSQSIKPDFDIIFLNENGFITASYSDVYIFSSVSPGETRISDGMVHFRYGSPIYYSLIIK